VSIWAQLAAIWCWVSGIPFTEAQALRSRGEDYRIYQQQTSMFFPWFPRRAATEVSDRRNLI
jgi:steroid 5-alpha reductase family enzyme